MKRKNILLISVAGLCSVAIISVLLALREGLAGKQAERAVQTTSVVSQFVLVTSTVPIQANYPHAAINLQSGDSVLVSADKKSISLRGRDGKTVWSNNIVEAVALDLEDKLRVVRGLRFTNDFLMLSVGRSLIVIDSKTGKIISADSN